MIVATEMACLSVSLFLSLVLPTKLRRDHRAALPGMVGCIDIKPQVFSSETLLSSVMSSCQPALLAVGVCKLDDSIVSRASQAGWANDASECP